MDPAELPAIGNYYPPAPTDPTAKGISSGAIDPNALVALSDSYGSSRNDKKKWYGIILGVLGILVTVVIGVFFYVNSRNAAASTDDSLIVQPGGARGTSAQPSIRPTILLPTFPSSTPKPGYALSPTGAAGIPGYPTAIPITVFTEPSEDLTPSVTPRPTFANNPATPTPSYTPTPSPTPKRTSSWQMTFPQSSYTTGTTNSFSISGTVKGPVEEDSVICFEPDRSTFVTKKKDSGTVQRLCDGSTPTPALAYHVCSKYREETGVSVNAIVRPATSCADGTVSAGSYVLYSRIYFDCIAPGGNLSAVNLSSCSKTDVFSEDVTLSP
jgi:hypothetical protein